MARYFLGCMHEQYHPRDLLEHAVAGERAGFDGIACSDHFQPWWEPGHSGQAWVWLGAAAQATKRVPVGPAVTVALNRYHPSHRASRRSRRCIRAGSLSASAPASR